MFEGHENLVTALNTSVGSNGLLLELIKYLTVKFI